MNLEDLLKIKPEELAEIVQRMKQREEARVAAMPEEERRQYLEEKARHEREEQELAKWAAEPATITNGELEEMRNHFDMEQYEAESRAEVAEGNALEVARRAKSTADAQGGTDRALTKALQRIKALEAENARLKAELVKSHEDGMTILEAYIELTKEKK